MGVSVYTMLAGACPFNGRTDEDVVDMVMAGHLSFHEPQWTHISSECKQARRTACAPALHAHWRGTGSRDRAAQTLAL
jgi:hypothetical protein